MNSIIINELNKLISSLLYDKPPNFSFKVNTFRKTITIIQNLDFQINSTEQLKNIKGIGKGTLERINEILKNGKLIENTKIDEKKNNIDNFNKLQTITGIGPAKAKQLIEKNISFERYIYSLGIRHIGFENAKLIAKTLKSPENFINLSNNR